MFAFANELLREISNQKRIKLDRVSISWDNLIDGMKLGRYDGILSSIQPTVINESKFSFSDRILSTGPVLITLRSGNFESVADFDNRLLLVSKTAWVLDYMSQYPEVELQFFDYVNDALEDVVKEKVAGALVPVFIATAMVNDLYHEQLKIIGSPLLDQGIRLVTMKDEQSYLLRIFNEGLEDLRANGKLAQLIEKWSLPEKMLAE